MKNTKPIISLPAIARTMCFLFAIMITQGMSKADYDQLIKVGAQDFKRMRGENNAVTQTQVYVPKPQVVKNQFQYQTISSAPGQVTIAVNKQTSGLSFSQVANTQNQKKIATNP